jgi:hypothetical protein
MVLRDILPPLPPPSPLRPLPAAAEPPRPSPPRSSPPPGPPGPSTLVKGQLSRATHLRLSNHTPRTAYMARKR